MSRSLVLYRGHSGQSSPFYSMDLCYDRAPRAQGPGGIFMHVNQTAQYAMRALMHLAALPDGRTARARRSLPPAPFLEPDERGVSLLGAEDDAGRAAPRTAPEARPRPARRRAPLRHTDDQ